MRILFLTQWFDPEDFYKGISFVKAFKDKGHEVQVLTGFPNYPGGKLYDGYKLKFLQKEIIDKVSVVRVPLYPSHNKSGTRRFMNYVSFGLSAAFISPWFIERPDVIYVYHPPATSQFAGIVIGLFRRAPLVYDIQDLWPDSLAASGMCSNKFVLWLAGKVCSLFYKAAKKIVVLSPGFKKELISRGVPADKVEIIYNWCPDAEQTLPAYDRHLAEQLKMDKTFNVLFAGNIGRGQALESVLDAANLVISAYPEIRFIFIGDGVQKEDLEKKAEFENLTNVFFYSRKSPEEIKIIFQLADVLLVHLKNIPLYRITIPSKTQAYLAACKPILMGVSGDAAELIKQAKAGLVCEPENPVSIAAQLKKLYCMPERERNKMGKEGFAFYHNEICFSKGIKKFEEIFLESVKKRKNA